MPPRDNDPPSDKALPARSKRPHKAPHADVKRQYPLFMEIGFLLALGLMIVLTQVEFTLQSGMNVPAFEAQEIVQMQEIMQTKQVERPPAPPRPAPPVEVPNDEIIEDEVINLDASLDLDERLDVGAPPPAGPPPPPKEEEPDPFEEVFIAVEEKPVLIGGLAALQAKVKYPPTARKADVQGRVIVQFIIDKDGNVTQPEVLQSPHSLLSEEAIRVIKLAKFEPGRQRGRAVKVQMSMPITFRIKDRPR